MKFLERIPDPLVLVGALIGLAVVCVAWEISTEYRRVVHPEVTSVYWLCNKDQISEILVNSPNGMSAAIATHCELHTYERKM
jgi:hypothetical protein